MQRLQTLYSVYSDFGPFFLFSFVENRLLRVIQLLTVLKDDSFHCNVIDEYEFNVVIAGQYLYSLLFCVSLQKCLQNFYLFILPAFIWCWLESKHCT